MKAEATGTMVNGMNAALRRMLKRLHYPLDVMLLCVRWYVAYPLSLRNLEEMMSERGLSVDHSTVHRLGAETAAGAGKVLPAAQASGG